MQKQFVMLRSFINIYDSKHMTNKIHTFHFVMCYISLQIECLQELMLQFLAEIKVLLYFQFF